MSELDKIKEIITAKRDELKADERLSYPVATIRENAPLALEQLAMETRIATLNWVLKVIEEGQ